ncbi:MAG: hypothetical protein GY778_15900 [bacterium]|nr:hypothetical protein [bacterium]
MKPILLALAVLTGGFAVAYAVQGDPPEMTCREVTVVRYYPGPNWAAFEQHLGEHLKFLQAQMAADQVLFAGPLVGGGGGFTIYALTDQDEVDALVRQDPLVINKVATHALYRWRMCQKAPPPAADQPPVSAPGS